MTPSGHLEVVGAEPEGLRPIAAEMSTDSGNLNSSAANLAHTMGWLPGQVEARPLHIRCQNLFRAFKPLLAALQSSPAKSGSDDFRLLHENILLVQAELEETCETFKRPHKLPLVRAQNGTVVPRIAAIAEDYVTATAGQFAAASFTDYVQAFQDVTVLDMAELWMLIPGIKLVLLEQIAQRSRRLLQDPISSYAVREMVRSLREIKQTNWKVVIEPLIRFDRMLREDPAGAYSRMDYESRELYRQKIVKLADHSDCSEMEVAKAALALAREAQKHPDNDPRVTLRRSHVGNYLLAEGTSLLEQRIDFHSSIIERFPDLCAQPPG